MWVTRLRIRHDCIIGNRCKNFGVTTTGTPFSVYVQDGVTYSPQVQTLAGEPSAVAAFITDLRKDEKVTNLEVEGNTVFLVEVQKKQKVTASVFSTLGPRIIFVKPVFVDTDGYEYWEVASWKKAILTDFIAGVMNEVSDDVKVLKIEQTKLTDIYFSRLAPKLSSKQKEAVSLAYQEGYYAWPKRTDLGALAKRLGVSVPTLREHLKRAEEKLMPEMVRQL